MKIIFTCPSSYQPYLRDSKNVTIKYKRNQHHWARDSLSHQNQKLLLVIVQGKQQNHINLGAVLLYI